jgi:hypothetical protein
MESKLVVHVASPFSWKFVNDYLYSHLNYILFSLVLE